MDKLVKIVCILILTSIFDRTDATLNLLIDGQQDYLEYKNSSYMLFKELFARIHLQCVGSKPTTFEVQMHRVRKILTSSYRKHYKIVHNPLATREL